MHMLYQSDDALISGYKLGKKIIKVTKHIIVLPGNESTSMPDK
jgi:hypothetical protein